LLADEKPKINQYVLKIGLQSKILILPIRYEDVPNDSSHMHVGSQLYHVIEFGTSL
jgi:hypothetical protein